MTNPCNEMMNPLWFTNDMQNFCSYEAANVFAQPIDPLSIWAKFHNLFTSRRKSSIDGIDQVLKVLNYYAQQPLYLKAIDNL